ncbi:Adaptin N terminal region family protein [Tritrichomonas foetus]|uniref:AP-1 complex subunit gamma n=1 Tax=Tritrichomonas foetus TaxID=1144522 RepID=A0A1J4J190_9EUKA|nr:Adaptin N terminal region family protein [Tritrichomonas foetus]|eukprot:OHS93186.1 Adaptin N terminal region family protein [Tritrichomonas foetus]
MSTPLQDFISNIREAESIEDEKLIIATELADMRTLIRECDIDRKPNIIAKLIYLNITGENTAWGQIDAVSLMSSDRLSYKRLGYLAVQTLFDEQSEILVLITQTLHRDLQSHNPLIQAFPLAFIANMGTSEICQSVYPEVERLTGSSHPGIVKRAGIAAVRIVRKNPDIAPSFKKALTRLLSNTKHAVVAAGVVLAMEMMKADQTFVKSWQHFAKPFTALLKTLSHSRPTAEFRMAIFNDPFLQIKTMQLLGMLQVPSKDLDEILTFLVTTVDVRRNTGRSLLLQAVETIGLTAKKQTLCGLAFNQVGRLLSHKEPNILYSVLSVFSRVLYNGAEIIDRSSRDTVALQRYKSQIVHCLDHRDPSIRRRALDVILALVDEQNAETLIPEIIEYLHLADSDFRSEMIVKIYSTIQRFAPTPMWHFDVVHMLLIDSGNYVGNDILTSFCRLIATNDDVRNHAIPLLANTMYGYSNNQALIKVAAWVIGEFQLADETSIDTMLKILQMPQTQVETKCYLITAVTKLAARLNDIQKVQETFAVMEKDNNIEIQQRVGEMNRLLKHPELWDEMLAPPDYKKSEQAESQKTAQIIVNHTSQPTASPIINTNSNPMNTLVNNTASLISLDDNPFLQQQGSQNPFGVQNQQNPAQQQQNTLIDDLLDIDLIGPSSSAQNNNTNNNNNNIQQQANVVQNEFRPPPNAVEALRTPDFVIYFEIQKNPTNPNQLAIRTTISNLGGQPLKNFNIQYGVPVGWVVRTQPMNNVTLNPRGQAPIQQILYLENRGNSPLMMKTHTTYLFGCQPLSSDDSINPIF